jgi:hypothetical protein
MSESSTNGGIIGGAKIIGCATGSIMILILKQDFIGDLTLVEIKHNIVAQHGLDLDGVGKQNANAK